MVIILLNVYLCFAWCGLFVEIISDNKFRKLDECQEGIFTGYTALLTFFLVTGIFLLMLMAKGSALI
jgi:hypothetical protein